MAELVTKNKIQLYPKKQEANGFLGDGDSWFSGEAQLSVDVYENNAEIIVKSTVAGVRPEDLEISISNDLLTIRGYREQDDKIMDEEYYCRECYWGGFSRTIVLPREVEQKRIDASIKNGVLTIKLPKKYKTSSIKVKQIMD